MDAASLGVGVFAFILYLNTLGAGFVYDDSRAVLRNPDVRGVQSTWLAFSNDFWGTPLVSAGSHGSYRPLSVLSLRANAFLAGGMRPHAFHLVNAQLHAVCSWLVARLSRRLVGGRVWPVAGLLFAAHPVHCEAVAAVVGRADLLAAALGLLALLCFMQHVDWREGGCRCGGGGGGYRCRCRGWQLVLLAATPLLTAAAMLCKEPGITVLLVCAAYDVIVQLRRRRRRQPLRTGSLAALGVSGGVLLGARLWLMGLRTPAFARADNPTAHSPSWGTRTLTFLHLPAVSLKLLLWPHTLSFDWSMDAVPPVEHLWDARNLESAALYTGLAVLVGRASLALLAPPPPPPPSSPPAVPAQDKYSTAIIKRRVTSRRRQQRPERKMRICGVCSNLIDSRTGFAINNNNNSIMTTNNNNNNKSPVVAPLPLPRPPPPQPMRPAEGALLSAALLVFPLLPATNLFFYVGFVIAERVLYLPSVGYCLLVTQGLSWLWGCRGTRLLQVGLALMLAVLAVRTVVRNRDWADEEALYRAGIPVNPPKAYGNLGSVLSSRDRLVEAEHAFRMALKYRPNMADVHYNLGNLLLKRDKLEEAIRSYQQAIRYRPSLALAHLHLGHAYAARGQVREAVEALVRCASLPLQVQVQVPVQVQVQVRDEAAHEAARVSALLLLAHLHAAHGRLAAAKIALTEAITARPEDYQPGPLYKLLAEVEERMRAQQGQAHTHAHSHADAHAQGNAHHAHARGHTQEHAHAQAQQEAKWSWRTRTYQSNESVMTSTTTAPGANNSSLCRPAAARTSEGRLRQDS